MMPENNTLRPARAQAFPELLAEKMVSDCPRADRSGLVVGLEEAVDTVWWTGAIRFCRELGKDAEGRPRLTEVKKRRYRSAVVELLKATEGQPFRIDTEAGPLFIQGALYRFAGQQEEGCFEGDAEYPGGRKSNPTPPSSWGSEWRLSVLTAPAAREVA